MADTLGQVKELQASMIESTQSKFDESELGHIRALVRLAVEFDDYLRNGSTEIARRVSEGPPAKYVPGALDASADPFNEYDLEYACDSIRSGVNSFCTINQAYGVLKDSVRSNVQWSMISSQESFKAQFMGMFNKFIEEVNFENKCRLLLDLFKLQMVFASVSCP